MRIETGQLGIFQERTVPGRQQAGRMGGPGPRLQDPGAGSAAQLRRRTACARQSAANRESGPFSTSAIGPATTLADHLIFALRHEDIDLLIFKRLRRRAGAEASRRWSAPRRRATRRGERGICMST